MGLPVGLAGLLLLSTRPTAALDNGVALTPPQAWTSWNLARFDVSAAMIEEMADALESTGLKALGWDTLEIDEGWEACEAYAGPPPGPWPEGFMTTCSTVAPRDERGWIQANLTKFPGGIKPLADRLHARGFKLGIYTSASTRACGGNWGSHGHEAADAAAFAAWGVDWVKIDNCNYGTVEELVANQRAISLALQATKRPMVIQMGAFVLPSLWNPHAQPRADYTNRYDLAPFVWAPNISNMWYTGPDKGNSWASTLRNIMINAQGGYAQKPGAYNFAGDLWCGTPQSNSPGEYMPPMSAEEERSTYAMWVIMAAPLMLGCDIRNLTANTLEYLTNEELLQVNQDAWGLQGSLVNLGSGGGQIYAKALSDGSFAFALLNLAEATQLISASWGMLFPASFGSMHVRDLWTHADLGAHAGGFSVNVSAHGCAMIRATPVKPPPPPPPAPQTAGQLTMAPCSESSRQRWIFRQDHGLSLSSNMSECLTFSGDGVGLQMMPCRAAYDASQCSVKHYVDCHPQSWMPGAEGCHLLGCCYKVGAPSWCFASTAPSPDPNSTTSRVADYQQWRWNSSDGGVHLGTELNVSNRSMPVCFDIRELPLATEASDARIGATVGAVDGYYPCDPSKNPNERFQYDAQTGHITSLCAASECSEYHEQCVTGAGPPPPPPPPYNGSLLWPKPQSESASGPPLLLSPRFRVAYSGASLVAKDVAQRYTAIIQAQVTRGAGSVQQSTAMLTELVLHIEDESDALTNWSRSENYTIAVAGGRATAAADTPFGALRACESFVQLVENVTAGGVGLRHDNIQITDWPEYPHRQILLDTSRRFYPVTFVKEILDAMSYAKLNVLHLHLTDFGRFSIESKLFPELNVGYPSAGYPPGTGDGRDWTQQQVRELVSYARLRGVRLVPEFEMPQHSRCLLPLVKTQGLQFCNESFPVMLYDDPEGKTVAVLKKLVAEMAALFDDDVFHLGMDEAVCSEPLIEYDPLDAGACGSVCNATTVRSLEHKLLVHTADVLGKRPMAWQNALFDCGDLQGCEPARDRVRNVTDPRIFPGASAAHPKTVHYGVPVPERPATDGVPSTIVMMYAGGASSDPRAPEPSAEAMVLNATQRGFYAVQTDASHLYLDTGSDSPGGYEDALWYDVSGGLLSTPEQRERFLGGGVCLWSDSYCSIQAECGGWASCIGGNPDTTKCAGGASWLQASTEDESFTLSAGGKLFPRSSIMAGSFWHYDASLAVKSEEFQARTAQLAAAMQRRGVAWACPPGCACGFTDRCGKPLPHT